MEKTGSDTHDIEWVSVSDWVELTDQVYARVGVARISEKTPFYMLEWEDLNTLKIHGTVLLQETKANDRSTIRVLTTCKDAHVSYCSETRERL